MTREEIIEGLKLLEDNMVHFDELQNDEGEWIDVHELLFEAIKALSQEPCEKSMNKAYEFGKNKGVGVYWNKQTDTVELPEAVFRYILSLVPTGHCKECKYFEYDSVAKVDGVPLIVAHEICNKWGNGCKTSEDGYCYLFEPQESEDK